MTKRARQFWLKIFAIVAILALALGSLGTLLI